GAPRSRRRTSPASGAAAFSGSRLSAARADTGPLVGDPRDLARAHLDAAAEVEHPFLSPGRVALAEVRGAAQQLGDVPRRVGHAVERQDGPELAPDAHLHGLEAELGVVRVPDAGRHVDEEHGLAEAEGVLD